METINFKHLTLEGLEMLINKIRELPDNLPNEEIEKRVDKILQELDERGFILEITIKNRGVL